MELTFGQQLFLTLIGGSVLTSLLTTYLNNKWTDRRLRDQWEREKEEKREQWRREDDARRRQWERQYRSEALGSFLAKASSVAATITSLEMHLKKIDVIDEMLAETQEEPMLTDAQIESLPVAGESLQLLEKQHIQMLDNFRLMHYQLNNLASLEERQTQMHEEMSSMIPPWVEDTAFFELYAQFQRAIAAWFEFWHPDRGEERAEDLGDSPMLKVIETAHKLNKRVKELLEETFD